MRHRWAAIVLGGCLVAGCGDPPPKPLTPDEERQFEQQRQEVRQQEKRGHAVHRSRRSLQTTPEPGLKAASQGPRPRARPWAALPE
jgi:hypothetical protein